MPRKSKAGWPVDAATKRPRTKHGHLDATTDPYALTPLSKSLDKLIADLKGDYDKKYPTPWDKDLKEIARLRGKVEELEKELAAAVDAGLIHARERFEEGIEAGLKLAESLDCEVAYVDFTTSDVPF